MALLIFCLTLILILLKPRGLGIGYIALGGSILALLTGVISLQDIPAVWNLTWNATFALIALVIISLILDEAGFFQWLALHLLRWGRGKVKVLFPLIIILGALITAIFTNDGTALIWTATVAQMLLLLKFPARATLAFLMATGFIADATSLPLPVSNLTNIITADFFGISFLRYSLVMIPVNAVGILTSLAVLWFYFQRSLPRSYDLSSLPEPDSVIRDRLIHRCSFPILGLLLLGYFFAEPLHIPVSCVVIIAAMILIHLSARWWKDQYTPVISILTILKSAPWQVILFSLGMYLIVFGLRNAGFTQILSLQIQNLSQWGLTISTVGMGLIATVLSNFMNNLPTVLINSLAIHEFPHTSEKIHQSLIYANLIGCNIGAKITPIGSLSTLLWLAVLNRKGFKLPWSLYIRISLVMTIPVLCTTLLFLSVWIRWLVV